MGERRTRGRLFRFQDKCRPWIVRLCWAYAAVLAVVLAVLWTTGDRWWGGTILCFAPRWPLLIPLPILLVLGFRSLRALLAPLAFAGVVLPLWLGAVIPLDAVEPTQHSPFRVITFNAQGGHGDMPSFARWALEQQPDVIFFQEIDEEQLKRLMGPNWHWSPSVGGVAIASRHSIVETATAERPAEHDRSDCLSADLKVGSYLVRVGVLHLPTPRGGLEALLHHDRRFVEIMASDRRKRESASKAVSHFLLRRQRVDLLAGDFNMPVESRIYQEFWGETTNAFSAAGWGLGYTKYTRWHGVRIDHILLENPGVKAAHVFVGPDVGSDHRPVMAELALPSQKTRKPPAARPNAKK